MEQWGKEITENGICFLPHIRTKIWTNTKKEDVIDYITIISSDHETSKEEIEDLEKRYIGITPYNLANKIFTKKRDLIEIIVESVFAITVLIIVVMILAVFYIDFN